MNEEKKFEKMTDEALGEVAGGMTRDLAAAYDVVAGKYSTGSERKRMLEAAGYNYDTVQRLVNGLMLHYDVVAKDVIAGKYGNGTARINALQAAGYDAQLVQDIVNGILLK